MKLPEDIEVKIPEFKIQDKLTKMEAIINGCRRYKEGREKVELVKELTNLYHVAKTKDNIFPTIIHAVKAGATQWEVLGVIREGMGFSFDQFKVKRPDFLTY